LQGGSFIHVGIMQVASLSWPQIVPQFTHHFEFENGGSSSEFPNKLYQS